MRLTSRLSPGWLPVRGAAHSGGNNRLRLTTRPGTQEEVACAFHTTQARILRRAGQAVNRYHAGSPTRLCERISCLEHSRTTWDGQGRIQKVGSISFVDAESKTPDLMGGRGRRSRWCKHCCPCLQKVIDDHLDGATSRTQARGAAASRCRSSRRQGTAARPPGRACRSTDYPVALANRERVPAEIPVQCHARRCEDGSPPKIRARGGRCRCGGGGRCLGGWLRARGHLQA